MKPLTKKLVESGILDKHVVQLMQMWGTFDGTLETVNHPANLRKRTEESLEQFAEELEVLIENRHQVKETRLEIPIVRPPLCGLYCPDTGSFSAVEDEMGRLIIPPRFVLTRGANIYTEEMTSKEAPWKVLEVEPLYQGDKLVAYQVTIEKPE